MFSWERRRSRRFPYVTERWQLGLLCDDLGGIARQPEDVHAATRPVDDVNVAPVVDLDVVRLDDELAAIREGIGVRGRDEVADFLRRVRLTDVDRPHARVEPRNEHDLLVEGRVDVLVRGVGAEPAAPATEVSARLGDLVASDGERSALVGDVEDVHELTCRALAFIAARLVHHDDEVADLEVRILGELGDSEIELRERGVGTHEVRRILLGDHGIGQVRRRRREGIRGTRNTVQQLVAVQDDDDAV